MGILDTLAEANAFHQGKHFVYSDGDHGTDYIDLRIFQQPDKQKQLSELSLRLMKGIVQGAALDLKNPVVIIGPETLGAIIAEAAAARHNAEFGSSFRHLRLMSTKHEDGTKTFGWGMRDPVAPEGRVQVVYVDDLWNAGSTFARCRPPIESYGKIVAVGVIADRGGMTASKLGVPFFHSLIKVKLGRRSAETCPLCREKIPIVTNLGHGEEFRRQNPNYPGGFRTI